MNNTEDLFLEFLDIAYISFKNLQVKNSKELNKLSIKEPLTEERAFKKVFSDALVFFYEQGIEDEIR